MGPNYATLDTETTGLGKKDEIVEISLVHANGTVLFHSLVKPTCEINWAAFNVHKISSGDLINQPTWADIADEFSEALNKIDEVYIYNKSFDLRMLSQTYRAHNLVMPCFNASCAMQKAKAWLMEHGMLSDGKVGLDRACAILKISADDVPRHRSIGDCILTNRVLSKILPAHNLLSKDVDWKRSSNGAPLHSPESGVYDHMKEMINGTIFQDLPFKEWVGLLELNGVLLEPVFVASPISDFSACYYAMGNLRVSASTLGSSFTPRAVLKRGVVYNKNVDGALLESLFLKGQLKAQRTYFQRFINSDEISVEKILSSSSLIKSTYLVSHTGILDGVTINAKYESDADIKNPYTQLSLDAEQPKGILLKRMEVDGIASIEFSYQDRYSGLPISTLLIVDRERYFFAGDGCVNKMLGALRKSTGIAISGYFRGQCDSDLFQVRQVFTNARNGQLEGVVTRYLDEYSYKNCMFIPKICHDSVEDGSFISIQPGDTFSY